MMKGTGTLIAIRCRSPTSVPTTAAPRRRHRRRAHADGHPRGAPSAARPPRWWRRPSATTTTTRRPCSGGGRSRAAHQTIVAHGASPRGSPGGRGRSGARRGRPKMGGTWSRHAARGGGRPLWLSFSFLSSGARRWPGPARAGVAEPPRARRSRPQPAQLVRAPRAPIVDVRRRAHRPRRRQSRCRKILRTTGLDGAAGARGHRGRASRRSPPDWGIDDVHARRRRARPRSTRASGSRSGG